MGKIKVKRKSTLIDMTAMSDVTVLLLTFFMLTSTFLQKEPTQVVVPPSVSQQPTALSNVVQVLVAESAVTGDTQPKVYLSITGEADPNVPDVDELKGTWASEPIRAEVFIKAVKEYERLTKTHVFASDGEIAAYAERFKKIGTFGVPFSALRKWLDMNQTDQDKFIGDMENPESGIPLQKKIFTGEFEDAAKTKPLMYSEFQIWMNALQTCSNSNLTSKMRGAGDGIAIKANYATSFKLMKDVLYGLRDVHLNKFTVVTALKSED